MTGKFWVNNHAHIMRAEDGIPDGYLARLLNTLDWMKFVSGTTRLKLTQGGLQQITIPLPPLAEQRRIVAKLDALTARLARARTDLARIPPLAEKMRREALNQVRLAHGNYAARPVADWAKLTFDGPFGSNLKSADYVSSGTRVVRLENIGRLTFIAEKETYVTTAKAAGLSRHTLHAGDILFSSFVDRNVRVCRLPEDLHLQAINKADCFAVRPDQTRCDPRYLTYMLASDHTFEHFASKVHGATRPRVGLTDLKAYALPCPPVAMQQEAVATLNTIFARADRLEAEAARAAALLDRMEAAILASAFRGELVPQDPADEPASELLARIRAARAAAPPARRGRRPVAA